MKLKLKNTPEQVELVKAMGSKNQVAAREAQEAHNALHFNISSLHNLVK